MCKTSGGFSFIMETIFGIFNFPEDVLPGLIRTNPKAAFRSFNTTSEIIHF